MGLDKNGGNRLWKRRVGCRMIIDRERGRYDYEKMLERRREVGGEGGEIKKVVRRGR